MSCLILSIVDYYYRLNSLQEVAVVLLIHTSLRTFQIIGLLSWLIISATGYAQFPNDQIFRESLNQQYLEHLIKIKIDSVRAENDCKPLVNDSILYIAAKHHAEYMAEKKRLTHDELEYDSTKTPQLRAEYYGAKNYGVGENALKTAFNVRLKSKKGKTFDGSTYAGLAESMVDGWVNSPGHFRNIITSEYQVTGVSLSVHPEKDIIYACQKFAQVYYQYSFEEPEGMFPYTNYSPPPIPKSFKGISQELLKHKHDWELKHTDLDKCLHCKQVVRSPPQFTLRVENNQFILRVENSKYVKDLIKDKKDGFAIELVQIEDYMCGNPGYYNNPSRRNGQCEINGRVLEPLYRADLFRGYKKRKTDKEIKFLSYIVKADSVPFSQRTYQYKLDRFDSEYFEIKLGRVPKDMTSLWQHNLLYIQDEQVCHVDYFTGYCGDTYWDTQKPERAGLDIAGDYPFTPLSDEYNFKFSFEKNKYEYNKDDLAPMLDSMHTDQFIVDSIVIYASTSIEGDSIQNQRLLHKRMENIVEVFQSQQLDSIALLAVGSIAWDEFYTAVGKSSKWNHLRKLSKNELSDRLNNGLSDSVEYILEKQRFGSVNLNYSIPINDHTLPDYIKGEYDRIAHWLNNSKAESDSNYFYLEKLHQLFKFTHQAVRQGRIDTIHLANMVLPKFYDEHTALAEKMITSSFAYAKTYASISSWTEDRKAAISSLMEQKEDRSFDFIYTLYMEEAVDIKKKEEVTREQVQAHIDQLEGLKDFYLTNQFAQINIERINFNLNMVLLNNVFIHDPKANEADAYESINEIYDWYWKNEALGDSVVYQLARMAVYYGNNLLALKFLAPYLNVDFIHAYALPLEYSHASRSGMTSYYESLIEASETMEIHQWCNLFFSDCGLPFQAFDYEQLRNTFCEKCHEENDYIRELLD